MFDRRNLQPPHNAPPPGYSQPTDLENFAQIKVIGVGGGGSNAVNRMIRAEVRGVEFIAVNTDAQALLNSDAPTRIRIGDKVTKGLGSGGNPDTGRKAAEESQDELFDVLRGADMIFIAAGMGGGTGTGAAPYLAQIAREVGALTVAVVTKPFNFEGSRRARVADEGIAQLRQYVDALITIPNQRLLEVAGKNTTVPEAFRLADDVLRQGIQGISDLITYHGVINVDFADVKAVMSEAGSALMAIGTASGDNRCVEAARVAIESPLLEISIDGAKGVLFNIYASEELSIIEVNEAAELIRSVADPDANIIFGAVIDPNMGKEVKLTLIATGFDSVRRAVPSLPAHQQAPQPLAQHQPQYTAPPRLEARPMVSYDQPRQNPARQPHQPQPPPPPGPAPGNQNQDDLDVPPFLRYRQR
jgi:cell division protein FtsZ